MNDFVMGDLVLSLEDIIQFPITALLDGADMPSQISSIDVALDEFRFLKLVEYLEHDKHHTSHPQDGTQISWRLETDVMMIGNDMELQDAIRAQQQDPKWKIDIFVRVLD